MLSFALKVFLNWAFIGALFFYSHSSYGNVIRIAGSDLLRDVVPDAIENSVQTERFECEFDFLGSYLAIKGIHSGEVDIAIVAIPEGTDVVEEEIEKLPFAYQIAILAVNRANPIESVSLKQLRGVFGVNPDLKITYWGELGLTGGWGLGDVQPVALRDVHSVALVLLKDKALGFAIELSPSVMIVEDESQLKQNLLKNNFSLGVFPNLPKEKEIKILPVSETEDHYAFEPSEQNIFYGDYPLQLPFYILYSSQVVDKDYLGSLLKVLYSDRLADRLRQHYFIPLPKNVREEKILNLDLGT